jgi:hypothetical protein
MVGRNQLQPQVIEFGARIFDLKPHAPDLSQILAHSRATPQHFGQKICGDFGFKPAPGISG